MTESTANASRIGPFTLSRRLDKDSIATVYRAHDSRDNRDVAIKLIHSQIDSSAALQAIREKQLDQVRHPAICRLRSVDEYQGLSYLAYEYADGDSLAELLAAKGLRGRDKLPLMRALVEGVAAMHEHGICHLGVTPERIKVSADNLPKILSIGRSLLVEAAGESAMVKRGELRYMAPEQFESGTGDERTDVFRLCLVLFEILSRKPAINATSTKDAREQLKTFALAPDALGDSRAALKLMAFLNKGLAANPEQRYPNAIEMLAAMPKVRAKRQPSTKDRANPPPSASPVVESGAAIGATAAPAAKSHDGSNPGEVTKPPTITDDSAHNGPNNGAVEKPAPTDPAAADANRTIDEADSEAGKPEDERTRSTNDQQASDEALKADEPVIAGGRANDEIDSETAESSPEEMPSTSEQQARTEALQADAGDGEKTLAYILDRLENSNDFPVLSQSVFEVNQMTSLTATATVSQIAEVILRDFALSNELLKLANSAYYGVRVEVTRVTDAIRLLGFEQVRTTANGLAYAAKIGPDMEQLRDAMLKSFASGLVARQLADDVQLDDSEESFLCAMFHDTGEHLTIHYLPDEHKRVTELLTSGQAQDKAEAATSVIGLTFASLGAAVARSWRFPEKIVTAIEGKTADGEPLDDPQLLQLSWIARGANDLCELASQFAPDDAKPALQALLKRLEEQLPMDASHLQKALYVAAEKAQAFAPVLGIDANNSEYMQALAQWGPPPAKDSTTADPASDVNVPPDTAKDAGTHTDVVPGETSGSDQQDTMLSEASPHVA